MYDLIRKILFQLDAEKSHHLALNALQYYPKQPVITEPVECMGLTFPNRVGLAAGLDKNAQYIDNLARLGFGFLEVGTVTPRPQPGNPTPRLFRLPQAKAIINRMGFNNEGVNALLTNVKRAKYQGILGINIGKNFDTPISQALDDYLKGMRAVYDAADYITVNISSPNTKNLRQLQQGDELRFLLCGLKEEQIKLKQQYERYVPLALKIAPDLDAEQIEQISQLLLQYEIDAVIATNTTLSREGVEGLPYAEEAGGLSGLPVRDKSTAVIRALHGHLADRIPIIGVGGILCARDAQEKIRAGAKLVQLYTGFIYRGPALIHEVARSLAKIS